MKFILPLLAAYCLFGMQSLAAQPLNDECVGAIAVTLPSFSSTSFFTVESDSATRSFLDPGCTSIGANDDLWYRFEAASDGIIFRYRQAVFNGGSTAVGYTIMDGCEGTEIACNPSFGQNGQGDVNVEFLPDPNNPGSNFELIPGEEYFLRVFAAGEGSGTFNFGLQSYQQNDECVGAEPITLQPAGVCTFEEITTVNFSQTQLPPTFCATTSNNDDGWYRFTATSEFINLSYENLTVVTGSSTGVGFSIHDGCQGRELACEFSFGDGSSGSIIANALEALILGQEYLLRLYLEGSSSSGTFDFCLQEADCRPALVSYEVLVDDCEDFGARVAVAVFNLGSGDSLTIVNDGGVPPLVFRQTGRDTTDFFPANGMVTFTAQNSESSSCDQERVLEVFCGATNQACQSRAPLLINEPGSCDQINQANNFLAATSEYPLNPSCGFYDGGDLWYGFTAPTETLIVELMNNPFSTFAMVINELNCDSGGIEVDCQTIQSETGQRVLTGLTVGQEYTMRIFDRGNDDFGSAMFCVQADISLPAELTSFSGRSAAKKNVINWSTAVETGVSKFLLQASPDGINDWREVGAKQATNTTERTSYSLEDPQPYPNTYYQLTTLDADGSFKLSEIITVTRPSDHLISMTVVPNPTDGQFELQFPGFTENAKVELRDLAGRLISRQQAIAGQTSLPLDLALQAPGVYLVRVTVGQNAIIRRVVLR